MPGKRNGLYIVGGGTNAATGGCPVPDVDGTQTLLVADNKTIVPRARGATGNAVKSNAWDENEVPLEGEELVTSFSTGKRGQWTRWRHMRGLVWRSAPPIAAPSCVWTIEAPTTWLASVNAGYPGEYSDRGAAMARVQAKVESGGEGRRRPDTDVTDAPAIGRMGTRRGVMSFYGAEFPCEGGGRDVRRE